MRDVITFVEAIVSVYCLSNLSESFSRLMLSFSKIGIIEKMEDEK